MEKVPVGFPAVSRGGSYGATPKYHLIYHEFPIILANGTGRPLEPRVGQVGTVRPLPAFAPWEMSGSNFPFRFRR
jgi:hypothetical protein